MEMVEKIKILLAAAAGLAGCYSFVILIIGLEDLL